MILIRKSKQIRGKEISIKHKIIRDKKNKIKKLEKNKILIDEELIKSKKEDI